MTTTTIRPVGEAALLLDCADLAAAVGLAERIETARTGAVDVVAAARTVLVTARDTGELPRLRRAVEELVAKAVMTTPASSAELAAAAAGTSAADSAHVVTLDVRYDGPDLADVAGLAGVSVEALVRQHTEIIWRAAFGGFAPGFFYLVDERELGGGGGGGDRGRGSGSGSEGTSAAAMPTVPRLGSPRPTVPAGSVALADRFCAVYPGASPGGWRLIGTTDAPMWDLERPRPALLAPGMRVRFREAVDREVGDKGAGGRAGAR